ncbi:L,D-transpeptidase family protein [Bradyrhizobium lablabi]|uniref:L,D-transpeptidase n=1 Tax=Bradyrhizobium lablabi TaxID=722472 RepID=UPI001BAC1C69|nr:L,D-transpeptidase [Bradyrhizobium lablabi]MBR1123019.1 L,D-transpeptidase family protein [Bradyrhizobium lablabi]
MMIKSILTASAVAALAVAETSLAQAQQGYPPPPGSVYSAAPPYPPGGYIVDERRRPAPDFDDLEDDEAPNGQSATALPPPGPILSPTDPRYARPDYQQRPDGRPVYSGVPTGPILSPDDPRYGRPAGPPPVIYADRPPATAPGDGRMPGLGGVNSNEDFPRPPGAVGMAPPTVTGAVPQQQSPQPQVGADGKPIVLSALPPEEQPDAAPVQLPPHLRRTEVAFPTKEPAGTIVVDTPNTYLYYVLGNGRAMRYGVRVGREGFTWTGVQKITKKTEWPDWYPPSEMIERQPYLPRFMAGGPGNPLGARAMYLGSTVYRIHGTNQPSTIGKFVSSGCIGMLNEDVSDLFERTKVGTRVVVMPGGPPPGVATASAAPPPAGPATAAPPQAQAAAPVPGTGPTVVPPLPPATTIR